LQIFFWAGNFFQVYFDLPQAKSRVSRTWNLFIAKRT